MRTGRLPLPDSVRLPRWEDACKTTAAASPFQAAETGGPAAPCPDSARGRGIDGEVDFPRRNGPLALYFRHAGEDSRLCSVSGGKIYQGLPQGWPVETWEPPAPALGPVLVPDTPAELDYPSGDGNPLADNTRQAQAMIEFGAMLKRHYRDRDDVFYAIDLLVYYSRPRPDLKVAPDALVAHGVPAGHRDSYQVWVEGKVPDFVLEVASPSTAAKDRKEKKALYRRLGVGEYWLYDPTGGLHKPRLRGFRLTAAGRYAELVGRRGPGKALAFASPCLGLELRFDGERLRMWDPAEGTYILSILELDAAWREALEQLEAESEARQEAEQLAVAEAQARQAAESRAQVAEERIQIEAQARQEEERARQEEERARQAAEAQAQEEARARQAAEAQAQEEARARQAAEDRLAELEAKLKASKDSR